MRAALAAVTVLTVASPAAAEPRAAEAAGELTWFRFTPPQRRTFDLTAAAVSGAVRIGPRTWLTGWMGGAHGNSDGDDAARAANPVVGVRFAPPLGGADVHVGLEVALPVATVGMRDGVRADAHAATYAGAATAGGSLHLWRWLAEWMTVAVPARVTLRRGGVTLAIDGAVAYASSVGGEYDRDSSAVIAQLGLAAERPIGARFAVTGRAGAMVIAAGGATEPDGVVELGGSYLGARARVDLRLGVPLADPGLSITAGTRWSFP